MPLARCRKWGTLLQYLGMLPRSLAAACPRVWTTFRMSIHCQLLCHSSPLVQIDEDSQADGTYSSTLTVVTVEPAGLSPPGADLTGKLRLLLVSADGGPTAVDAL